MKRTVSITENGGYKMARDTLCTALKELYGYDPHNWDGLTLAELWQQLTDRQMNQVLVQLPQLLRHQ
jgi:hypothetical protein